MRALLGEPLKFDSKVVTVTVISTLVLMVDHYHRLTAAKWIDRTLLYFVVPMLVILFVFRERPSSFGFQLGDWKAGLIITLVAIVLIAPVLWFVGRGVAMSEYYDQQLAGLPWNTFLDLFGWEFLFRGWILFAYARRFGPEALWLQAVPFALAHLGKPEVETLSTIFGGFVFGWVGFRTRSFIYPLLIHWFVASFTVVVAAGLLG